MRTKILLTLIVFALLSFFSGRPHGGVNGESLSADTDNNLLFDNEETPFLGSSENIRIFGEVKEEKDPSFRGFHRRQSSQST